MLFQYGNETFRDAIILSTGKDCRPKSVCVFDINNDNQSDIIVAHAGFNNIGVFLTYGNRSFTETTDLFN